MNFSDFQERREKYLQEIRVFSAPEIERAEIFLGHGADYAQIGLRWAFFLNGGALVALPAFSEFVDVTASSGEIAFFILGLILAGLCSLATFVNFVLLAEQRYAFARRHSAESEQMIFEVDRKRLIKKMRIKANKYRNFIKITYFIAPSFGFFSYILFLFGCMSLIPES